MGAALTGRGGTGAQIAAMRGGQQAAMATNQAAAQQRAAEQLAAEQQVGGLLGQQAAGAAGFGAMTAQQAGLEQGWAGLGLTAAQANQANAQALALANQQAAMQAQQLNQAGYIDVQGLNVDAYNAAMASNAEIAQANLQAASAKLEQDRETVGGMMSGAGGAIGMMASDERSKARVESLGAENADLRRALEAAARGSGPKVEAMREARPASFEYRPEAYGSSVGPQPAAAPGERMVGVMAQDLARGGDRGMVTREPYSGSLGVNTGQLASAAAAGSSAALQREDELERRMRSLESRYGARV